MSTAPGAPLGAAGEATARTAEPAAGPIDLVVVGSSTGGPDALAEVLGGLQRDLAVPVVVVQHMPPVFTRLLTERLDRACAHEVREGADGADLEPGAAWIALDEIDPTITRRAGTTGRVAERAALASP
ncbi:chemotaxis protein CheB [Ilumatobacter sp.]|uniref:chemotaxis protein CheB n=1 Tax=Ilumatobacter sp. TaxID=1967498 RepID=UPI003B527E0A